MRFCHSSLTVIVTQRRMCLRQTIIVRVDPPVVSQPPAESLTSKNEKLLWSQSPLEQQGRLGAVNVIKRCVCMAVGLEAYWVAHFDWSVQVKRRSNSKPLECWHWKGNISSHHVSRDIPHFLPCHMLWWQRNKTGDKIWDKWVQQLHFLYNPGTHITVDECLVLFCGRCPFRQYMQRKPAKYGIKYGPQVMRSPAMPGICRCTWVNPLEKHLKK